MKNWSKGAWFFFVWSSGWVGGFVSTFFTDNIWIASGVIMVSVAIAFGLLFKYS